MPNDKEYVTEVSGGALVLEGCPKCNSPLPRQPYYLLKRGQPTPETIYTTENSIPCDSFWHLGGLLGNFARWTMRKN